MKPFRWFVILFFCFTVAGCGKAGTHSLYLRYQSAREFPALLQKVGPTVGLAPFKDERRDTLYIGRHTPLRGVSSYFKSDPSPLEHAILDSLAQVLSRHGVKTVSVAEWDGKPESLKKFETDSLLMVEIRQFWTEGKAFPFRTQAATSIHFLIHLGVKKEGKVFTRNIEVEKETTLPRLTPERIEETVNQILTDTFDSFLANPY